MFAKRHLNPHDPEERNYYYPMLALYVQVRTTQQGFFNDTTALRALINHTRLQLVRQMPTLAPDQRVFFYDAALLPFFDLYHSLLARHYLDGYIDLEDALVQQSISVKI